MQEVGLKKGEFCESLVENMSKVPQPPLQGMFGNDHFGHSQKQKNQWKKSMSSRKRDKLQKMPISMKILVCMIFLISFMTLRRMSNLYFSLHDILDQFHVVEENAKLDKFFIRYLCNVLTLRFYFENNYYVFSYVIYNYMVYFLLSLCESLLDTKIMLNNISFTYKIAENRLKMV